MNYYNRSKEKKSRDRVKCLICGSDIRYFHNLSRHLTEKHQDFIDFRETRCRVTNHDALLDTLRNHQLSSPLPTNLLTDFLKKGKITSYFKINVYTKGNPEHVKNKEKKGIHVRLLGVNEIGIDTDKRKLEKQVENGNSLKRKLVNLKEIDTVENNVSKKIKSEQGNIKDEVGIPPINLGLKDTDIKNNAKINLEKEVENGSDLNRKFIDLENNVSKKINSGHEYFKDEMIFPQIELSINEIKTGKKI